MNVVFPCCANWKTFVADTNFVSATDVVCAGKRGNICVGNNVSSFARAFKSTTWPWLRQNRKNINSTVSSLTDYNPYEEYISETDTRLLWNFSPGATARLETPHERFSLLRPVNRCFLLVCVGWQVRAL